MADSGTGEKTEKPSAKRLREARERGQVPRSQDLVAAIALLGVTLVLARTGEAALGRIQSRLADGLLGLGDSARASMDIGALSLLVRQDVLLLGLITGPALFAAAVIALAGNVAQSGWVFAPTKLTPDWSRLSPANGLSRLKPSQGGLDLLKTLIAMSVITAIAYTICRRVLLESTRLASMAPENAAVTGWGDVQSLFYQVGFALLALAAADLGLQWWRHYSSLKMTRQELTDEAKSSDGRPEVKARVRRIQRDMNRKRMLTAVKTATVVVTNPTHYAVALRYERSAMAAPVVVAKGKDLLAQRIKKIARDAGVPTVENVPLAQALYAGAEVGEAIPSALFGAVAEVLAYLVRIRQLML
jgi:flagellar biosynthetic protein FlhB